MLVILAQIFIGSSLPFSLTISLLGIYFKRPYFLVIGSILSTGFAWYLTGSPLLFIHILGYFCPCHTFLPSYLYGLIKNWVIFWLSYRTVFFSYSLY